ncbi:hypothetical protein Daus18300_010128 [Diaporthe australafricana]|uniref:C2H2-type domain-containing protein n=1 Tax=Diaporthe australafricana TaxID=127596 RepID=A0ABR3WBI3_9PEZI
MNNQPGFTIPDFQDGAFYQELLGQPNPSEIANRLEHGKDDLLHNICAICSYVSTTKSDLEQHALNSGHLAFSCTCGAQFARSFCLTRHINSKIGPSFQCDLCDDKAFPRLDKLGDHLRRWHRLGVRALARYKRNSHKESASLSNGVVSPIPAAGGDFGQGYPVTPGFGLGSMSFGGFPSASSAEPSAASAECSTSPGSSTVSS